MKVNTNGLTGSEAAIQSEVLMMRYYFNAELGPSSLKAALERVKGVTKVEFDTTTRTVKVTYSGTLKQTQALEPAAAAAGVPAAMVSHARIVVGFKVAGKNADLTKLNKELQGLSGVKKAILQNATAEIYADLDTFTFDTLKTAAANAGFEAKMTTHEFVTVKLSTGDASTIEKDLNATKGVIVVKSASGDTAEMWTVKKIADDTFKKMAEKAKVVVGEIVRL